jgi:hypothetical protein
MSEMNFSMVRGMMGLLVVTVFGGRVLSIALVWLGNDIMENSPCGCMDGWDSPPSYFHTKNPHMSSFM